MLRSAVILIIISAALAAGCAAEPAAPAAPATDTATAVPNVSGPPGEAVPDEGRGHVTDGTPLTHNTYPPASGTHYNRWMDRGGFVDGPLSPGVWIHNLEHGYVVVLYKCPPDCAALKENLRTLGNKVKNSKYGYPKLVIAQDDKIEAALALLAWNRRQMLTSYDEGAIQAFYNAFVDRGPEDAP